MAYVWRLSQSDMGQIWARVISLAMQWYPLWQEQFSSLCSVYYNKYVSMSGMMMDLGSNSGNLSDVHSIRNLILVDLIWKHNLSVCIYMSGPDNSISNHDVFLSFMAPEGLL